MKRSVLVGIGVVIAIFVGGMILFSRTGPARRPTKPKGSRDADESVKESVREILQKATSAQACRNAIHQLNTHLDRNPGERPQPLADREGLQKQLGLDADELAEVNSTSFTLLDAHHLDLCVLLRDAARSLEVEGRPALERAKAAFAWVVRQVRLREPEQFEPMLPPQFVLRRGWGTSQERAVIFLELLHQMEIPGCMTAIPAEDQPGRYAYWIPGALIDKEIYLFDTRLGLPLPGAEGQEVATLRHVRTVSNPFQALAIDDKHHYDVTEARAKGAEIHLLCSLSEAAPRMTYLESILAGPRKIRLAVDPGRLEKEFREATRDQNIPVHFWGGRGEANAPVRVLRNYFPPAEGGTEKTGWMAQRSRLTLLPPGSIPPVIFARDRQFGEQIAQAFALPFIDFFLSPSTGRFASGNRSSTRRPGDLGAGESASNNERNPSIAGESMRVIGSTQSPRELALRGSFDEASLLLVNAPVTIHFRETLLRMLGPFADVALEEEREWVQKGVQRFSLETLKEMAPDIPADLEQRFARWCDQAVDAYSELIQIQERSRAGQVPEEELERSWKRIMPLWKEGDKLLTAVFFKHLSNSMGAEASYLLALCKHERAIRMQGRLQKFTSHPSKDEEAKARSAWNQAATWWGKFEFEYGSALEMPTARLRLAEALTSLGDYPAALSQLENLSGGLSNLDETARLYQSQQLRKKLAKN